MAQPMELRYCFSRFRIQDHSRWMLAWCACQTAPNKGYAASVVTRSRKSKDCVTFSGGTGEGKPVKQPQGAEGYARGLRQARRSRLKGGCRQDCLPH